MADFVLDELWRVSTEVELPGHYLATIKAMGDIDNRQVEEYAIAERIRFRRLLEDPFSQEYLSLIEPWQDQTADKLLDHLCYSFETLEAIPAAIKAYPQRFVDEPSDADTDAKAAAREEQQRVDKENEAKRLAASAADVQKFRESLSGLPLDALLVRVKEYSVRLYTDARYFDARKWCAIYLSAYDKDGRRIFRSANQVQNVPSQVVALIYAAYVTVNSKNPWDLEKAVLRKN